MVYSGGGVDMFVAEVENSYQMKLMMVLGKVAKKPNMLQQKVVMPPRPRCRQGQQPVNRHDAQNCERES